MKTAGTSLQGKRSFDVFGTLLFRRISNPEKRFVSFAGKGQAAEDWARKRTGAELALVREKGPDLYSLDDIYKTVGLGGPTAQAELEMELAQCFVGTEGRRLLAGARKNGEPVIFVSDMYLPGKFIRQILEEHGLWQKGDQLFVSHEQGKAKHHGLFQKICEELSLAPAQLEHAGDHLHSDVLIPRQLGIRTVHFRPAEPSRYETTWTTQGGKEGEAVADAIRSARLQFPEALDERQQTFWETACEVASPLFIAYVLWLEKQARELGLERLYFISRDGLIFKRLYDEIFPAGGSSPQSHYLYGSRQAWGGVRAATLEEEDIDALLQSKPSLSLRQFFARCGWSKPPQVSLPWAHGRPREDDPLQPAQLDQLRQFLQEGELREKILAQGQSRRQEARGYLEQEGLGAGRYGLVDLGWYGNLQSYLARMIPENPPAAGFYLDLRKTPEPIPGSLRKAFLPFGRFRGIRGSVATTLLEILAAAPHGTVLGYEVRNRRWGPVLSDSAPRGGPEEHAAIHHEAVLKVVREFRFQGLLGNAEPGSVYASVLQANLEALIVHPSAREAEAYGAIHFVSRQEGGGETEFAPSLDLSGAVGLVQRGFWSREALWPQACIRRSRGWAKLILWLRFMVTASKERLRFLVDGLWSVR